MLNGKRKLQQVVNDMKTTMVSKDIAGASEIISSLSYSDLQVMAGQFVALIKADTTTMKHTKLTDMERKDWVELIYNWSITDFTPEDKQSDPMPSLRQD